MALALLNISFFSVWTALCPFYPHGDDGSVDAYPLIAPLEAAFRCPTLPHGVLNRLLGLAEFMELREKPLPIGASTYMCGCLYIAAAGSMRAWVYVYAYIM